MQCRVSAAAFGFHYEQCFSGLIYMDVLELRPLYDEEQPAVPRFLFHKLADFA